MRKKINAITLGLFLIASLTACGAKEETEKKELKKEVEAVAPVTFQTEDIADVTSGIEDRVVLQNAEDLDFLANVIYDDTIVKEVSADSTGVDLATPGEYKAVYQIKVDAQALTDYLNAKNDTDKHPKIVKGKNDVSTVDKQVKVTVVTPEDAAAKADAGEIVWGSQNQPVAQSDGTEVEAKAETLESNPESTVSALEVKKQKAEKKQETAKKETPKKETASSSTGNKKPSHTHNYNIPIKKTVKHDATGHYEKVWVQDSAAWDEDIYENRTICNYCKADITGNTDHCAWCGPNGEGSGYSVRPVKVGTKHHDATGHYDKKWVVDKEAWKETKTVGWKCSCGAKK